MTFNINKFKDIQAKSDRYEKQLSRMQNNGLETLCIERTL